MAGMRATRLGGWTLSEVLLAMGIVLVLSGGVGMAGRQQIERARHLAAGQQIARIELALDSFLADVGRYPSELEGLAALVEPPLAIHLEGTWRGPYLRSEVPNDPWGHPFRYRLERQGQLRLPRVTAPGAAGTEGEP
mgnify:FL=1